MILIAVAIIAILAVIQFERLGYGKNSTVSIPGEATSTDSLTPIERAQNVKKLIETRDQNMLNQ